MSINPGDKVIHKSTNRIGEVLSVFDEINLAIVEFDDGIGTSYEKINLLDLKIYREPTEPIKRSFFSKLREKLIGGKYGY